MPLCGLGQNPSRGYIQGSEQGHRCMAEVIMGVALGAHETKGKARLRAFKDLALVFLVHTDHHMSSSGGFKYNPTISQDLFHQQGIGGKLEGVT